MSIPFLVNLDCYPQFLCQARIDRVSGRYSLKYLDNFLNAQIMSASINCSFIERCLAAAPIVFASQQRR